MIEEVLLEKAASPDEVASVEGVFARAGFEVEARPGIEWRSGDLSALSWFVMIVLGVPMSSFFGALGAEAGKDAYRAAIKPWLRELFSARRPEREGTVELMDPDGNVLSVSSDLPDGALDALTEIPWADRDPLGRDSRSPFRVGCRGGGVAQRVGRFRVTGCLRLST